MASRSERAGTRLVTRPGTEVNRCSIPCPHLTSQPFIPFKSCSPYTSIYIEVVGMHHLHAPDTVLRVDAYRTPNSRHLAHRCGEHSAASLSPPPMAHYDIFSAQLAINYPAYGHALWEPRPPRLYCPVEVGDVGFIREGRFHRLFNALLSADHPSHKIGVPEHYESLIPSLSDYIVSSTLSPSHYCSAGITSPAFL